MTVSLSFGNEAACKMAAHSQGGLFRCWNVCEQWGTGAGSWGTLDSLFLGHLGKCLSTVAAAGSAQPEAEQLGLPPSQAFSWLLGYHCVLYGWANICAGLVYIQNINKFSKAVFERVRLFAKAHYWLGGFAHHVLDLRFASCRCRPFQGEGEKTLKCVQRNVCIRSCSLLC